MANAWLAEAAQRYAAGLGGDAASLISLGGYEAIQAGSMPSGSHQTHAHAHAHEHTDVHAPGAGKGNTVDHAHHPHRRDPDSGRPSEAPLPRAPAATPAAAQSIAAPPSAVTSPSPSTSPMKGAPPSHSPAANCPVMGSGSGQPAGSGPAAAVGISRLHDDKAAAAAAPAGPADVQADIGAGAGIISVAATAGGVKSAQSLAHRMRNFFKKL